MPNWKPRAVTPEITVTNAANSLTGAGTRGTRLSAKVRVSPISRAAAILIIAVGVFVLLAGLATQTLASDVAGGAFVVLGVLLYALLYSFTRKLEREFAEAQKA